MNPVQLARCLCVLTFLTLLHQIRSYNEVSCDELQPGQYDCRYDIDNNTQTVVGCSQYRRATVECAPVPGLVCVGLEDGIFKKEVPCRYTNGKSYRTSVLLSVFLGMFGIDRFYLGYPAIGLLKFCTMGLLFVGQFVDFILIATQVVKPADGSDYILDYYAPEYVRLSVNNETYFQPRDDL